MHADRIEQEIVIAAPVERVWALVEFTLTPQADGTRLRLVESGFASLAIPPHREATASYESHAGGWTDILGDVARHAERLAA
jgi:uncharacterized protein YndB with AHSA1/START domain